MRELVPTPLIQNKLLKLKIVDLRMNEIPGFEYLEIISHASPKKTFFECFFYTHIYFHAYSPR